MRQAVKDKRKIIYFRFAAHEPLITDVPEVETINIPLSHRFENISAEFDGSGALSGIARVFRVSGCTLYHDINKEQLLITL